MILYRQHTLNNIEIGFILLEVVKKSCVYMDLVFLFVSCFEGYYFYVHLVCLLIYYVKYYCQTTVSFKKASNHIKIWKDTQLYLKDKDQNYNSIKNVLWLNRCEFCGWNEMKILIFMVSFNFFVFRFYELKGSDYGTFWWVVKLYGFLWFGVDWMDDVLNISVHSV